MDEKVDVAANHAGQQSIKNSDVDALHADETNISSVEAALPPEATGCEKSVEPAEETSRQFDACENEIVQEVVDRSPPRKDSESSVEGHDDFLQNEGLDRMSTGVSDDSLAEIDPPQSRTERFRDALFHFLDIKLLRILGFVVIFLVVVDGAFFFFLLVGWHGMCTPRTDCEPRNWWYNWSIQALNVLFTYTAIVSFPARLANAIHLAAPKRSSEIGMDLYGRPTKKMWYHIPQRRRWWIVTLLIGNCLFQWANQITRIKFYNYELSNSMPGVFWTNIFFFLAFLLAGVGAIWQLVEQHKLHVNEPDKFPPSPFVILREQIDKRCCSKKKSENDGDEDEEIGEEDEEMGEKDEEMGVESVGRKRRRSQVHKFAKTAVRRTVSPWKKLGRWFRSQRSAMRLWGF